MLNHFSCAQLFATLWTVARQAPLSKGFSRQEHWSEFLCVPPGDLPDPGIKASCLTSPALLGGFFPTSATWEAQIQWQWKWVVSDTLWPVHGLCCTVHGILQARILEWRAFPFCRGSSQSSDQTQVSCITGRFFTSWATREAKEYWMG